MIYLDYAATSPALPEMFAYQALFSGDEKDEAQARGRVARLLCCQESEIVFTSGGTESDDLAILGTCRRACREKRPLLIVTSETEHEAVLNACDAAKEFGEYAGIPVTLVFLKPDAEGAVSPEKVKEVLNEYLLRRTSAGEDADSAENRTGIEALIGKEPLALVSLMAANNETGVLTDLEAIGRICREAGALFHTDAVQAVGHVPMDLEWLPVDMLSAAAHKFGGPKGVGFLYVREGTALEPMIFGAGHALRPGTLNTPGIIGMGIAAEYRRIHLSQEGARLEELRDLLQSELRKKIPDMLVNGTGAKLPGHLNVSFPGIQSASLLFMMDMNGLCASGGSACAAQSGTRSRVLTAMGLGDERTDSAVRFTLGPETTEAEIRESVRIVAETVLRLRMLREAGPYS